MPACLPDAPPTWPPRPSRRAVACAPQPFHGSAPAPACGLPPARLRPSLGPCRRPLAPSLSAAVLRTAASRIKAGRASGSGESGASAERGSREGQGAVNVGRRWGRDGGMLRFSSMLSCLFFFLLYLRYTTYTKILAKNNRY